MHRPLRPSVESWPYFAPPPAAKTSFFLILKTCSLCVVHEGNGLDPWCRFSQATFGPFHGCLEQMVSTGGGNRLPLTCCSLLDYPDSSLQFSTNRPKRGKCQCFFRKLPFVFRPSRFFGGRRKVNIAERSTARFTNSRNAPAGGFKGIFPKDRYVRAPVGS